MPVTDETRKNIYDRLRRNLEKYSPPMVSREKPGMHDFELIGNKPVPYGYDKKIVPGMYFASIAHRKDSVAFYFFPGYMNPSFREIAPSLHKYLKGKTCFHFKKEEQVNEDELNAMLKKGVEAWTKAGYMK
jgi:hypothetical protein